jgi:RHS repeat-associated protein
MSVRHRSLSSAITRLAFGLVILFTAAQAAFASTATTLVPASAPHGARVIILGTGLDATDVTVSFPTAGGQFETATVVSRTPTLLEVVVPASATTGELKVTNAGGTIGTPSFTLAPDPGYAKVLTLAGKPNGDDDHHDGDDGSALFRQPVGLAAVPSGDLFVADATLHEIRRVTPAGVVSVFAGSGKAGYKEGAAGTAQFRAPQGITYDLVRKVFYVADTGNSVIRKVAQDGTVSLFAGTAPSNKGSDGDGGETNKVFDTPTGLALDAAGNLYVADTGLNQIFVVTPGGLVTSLAGSKDDGLKDGPAKDARFKGPQALAVTAGGTVYVADAGNNAIRKIDLPDTSGVRHVTSVVVSKEGDDDGANSTLSGPAGIVIDDAGNLLVADTKNHRIRLVNLQTSPAKVTTVAGTGKSGFVDGAPSAARFNGPTGLVFAGALYVADTKNDAIREVLSAPTLSDLFPRTGPLVGGDVVRLFGAGFVPGATMVKFGTNATNITVLAATELLLTVRAGTAGSVTVSVTTPAGTGTLTAKYTYIPPPTLGAIVPSKGPNAGGTAVAIAGTNFIDGATAVTIGGAPAPIVSLTGTSITALTPAKASGPADVAVTTPGGTATLPGAFRYEGPPTITGFAPPSARIGVNVTISGTNFDTDSGATHVQFGSLNATIASITATQIVATVPTGAVDGKITVTTAGGTAQTTTNFVVAVLRSITLTPATASMLEGGTQPFTAKGVFSDGATLDFTSTATWSTSDSTVASVSATGVLKALRAGTVTVSATSATVTGTATVSIQPQLISIAIAPPSASILETQTQAFAATGSYDDGSTKNLTSSVTWTSSDTTVATVGSSGVATPVKSGGATITATIQGLSATAILQVNPAVILPPDPAAVAPPIDPTKVTTIEGSTRFLYAGPSPIQSGVTPGTIERERAALLRGRVLNRANQALPGVHVSISGHGEFGSTLSRADGRFDLAVNGGGSLTVRFEAAGFISSDRTIDVPWNDYRVLEDVVLVGYDPVVTPIALGSTVAQVARGTVSADPNGTRQATLIFQPGTSATMTLPGGAQQALSTMSVRATEFTVGENGPRAMPASLPPQSGYTYCVELSADEAVAAAATQVTLDKPATLYLENYRSFPAGGIVPVGYYDRTCRCWVAMPNGRIVTIVSIVDGRAYLDINGDGIADDSDSLIGTTPSERDKLATLYTVGASVWRVSIPHLTSWDPNWPYGPPLDATPPNASLRPLPEPANSCSAQLPQNSVIECEAQALTESVPITGTGLSINYSSVRAPGRQAARKIHIPVAGAETLPASLLRIEVKVTIAGKETTVSLPPQPNQSYDFTWDRTDAYARPWQGTTTADIAINYVYPALYLTPRSELTKSFGAVTSTPGVALAPNGWNMTAGLVRQWNIELDKLGTWDARGAGFGGWTLDTHDFYDHSSGTEYTGGGTRRRTPSGTTTIRSIVLGGPPATMAGRLRSESLGNPAPSALAADVQGNVFAAADGFVYRIARNGTSTVIAGSGSAVFNGDGIPAASAGIQPTSIAVGPDGSVYLADEVNRRVRRIANGTITTVAGNGNPGVAQDDEPAAANAPITPRGISVTRENLLYITDRENNTIRVMNLCDGRMWRVLSPTASALNGRRLATTAVAATSSTVVKQPEFVTTSPSGEVYFTWSGNAISKVTQDGKVVDVAPPGPELCEGYSCFPSTAGGLAFAGNTLYYADPDRSQILSLGNIVVAGQGSAGSAGDGGYAQTAFLSRPRGVIGTPDGKVYIADTGNQRLRVIEPPFPKMLTTDTAVASSSGNEVHVFDLDGRHVRTLDPLLGITREQFQYNADGYLTSITDVDGNVTRIERSGPNATAIIAPGGQRTSLLMNGDGYLQSVANPAGETHQFSYAAGDGLMSQRIDPRGNPSTYAYDSDGRLANDADAEGGSKSLMRSGDQSSYSVSVTTAEGRSSLYAVATTPAGTETKTLTDEAGLVTTGTTTAAGLNTGQSPDGSSSSSATVGDPRFGLQSGFRGSSSVVMPSIGAIGVSQSRNYTFASDGQTVQAAQRALIMNGRAFSWTFDVASRSATTTTPEGRLFSQIYDANGHILTSSLTSLAPTSFHYDGTGLLTSADDGDRHYSFGYDSRRRLVTVTDPISRVTRFNYDDADRIVSKVLADSRIVSLSYDTNGNITSVTPPGRPVHTFGFNRIDLQTSYAAPGLMPTQYTYNRDRQLTVFRRPDGTSIRTLYDTAGRISQLALGRGTYSYEYDAGTGNLHFLQAPDGSTITLDYTGSLLQRVTSAGGPGAGIVSWNYDTDLRVNAEAVACSGPATSPCSPVAFTYDRDNLLTGAGNLTLTHDAQDGLLISTIANSVQDTYSYNSHGEVTTYAASVGGSPVFSEELTRDAVGRIVRSTETIEGTVHAYDYAYDPGSRLVSVMANGATNSTYAYDANGNRTRHVGPAGAANAIYDDQDRMVSYGQASYVFGAAGDLQSVAELSGMTFYTYDELGNLIHAHLADGNDIDYVIDAQNRRVGRKHNGALVQQFLYSGPLRVAAALDASGNVTSRFIYGTHINVPDTIVRIDGTYRVITDHLGSVRVVVDESSGSIVQRMDYDEFGNVLNDTNPGFQPFGFAGGLYDPDTKLIRFGARDYDPRTGRWTSKDIIGFGGGDTNLYVYSQNDPVNLIDPDGLKVFPADFVGPLQPGDVRAYSANLADPRLLELQVPPYRNNPPRYYGESHWCVSLTKYFTGAPKADFWRAGPSVIGNDIPPGTAIATFNDEGKYPNQAHGNNSGIYLYTNPDGSIVMIDQWPGQEAHARTVFPDRASPSDNSNAYSVITTPNH